MDHGNKSHVSQSGSCGRERGRGEVRDTANKCQDQDPDQAYPEMCTKLGHYTFQACLALVLYMFKRKRGKEINKTLKTSHTLRGLSNNNCIDNISSIYNCYIHYFVYSESPCHLQAKTTPEDLLEHAPSIWVRRREVLLCTAHSRGVRSAENTAATFTL